ncbi:ABC transporter permease [uncultured Corynebacterium sp.]|uniref:ABC transporter permease n=1 Tax=uncultured Corynebacterium sp. TaxID=159447 RepID=UPI00261DA404|nr:ABC transporter permease [uncultured Corynebacterium sp.]
MSKTKTLLKLHCKLWAHAFVGNLQMIIASVAVTITAVMGCIGLGFSSYGVLVNDGDPAMFVLTMGLGSVLYLAMSATFPSEERMLDPRMFSSLPLTDRDILPGMVTAMFINSRAAISLVNTIIMATLGYLAFAEVASAGAGALWVLACVLQLVITLLAGEALAAALSSIATKFSELWGNVAGLIVTFGFLALYLLPQLLTDGTDPTAAIRTSADILSWTPFAAAAGAAADLAAIGDDGVNNGGGGTDLGTGLAKGAICLVAILAVAYIMRVAVKHDLNNPLPTQHATRAAKGDSLLLPRVPSSPVGALYSREMRYWRRDNRFMMSLMVVVVLCGLYLLMGILNEANRWMLWFALFFVSLGPQQVAGNSLGMDGPSNWVHMVAGVRGKQIVASRSLSTVTVLVPIWLIVCIAAGAIDSFSATWLLVSLLTLGCILLASAMANFSATRFPAQTTAPGTNSFKQRNGGSNAIVSALVTMLILTVSFLPGGLLALVPLAMADGASNSIADIPLLSWLGVLLHWVIVIGAAWIMNRRASRRLDLEWPDIAQKVQQYL